MRIYLYEVRDSFYGDINVGYILWSASVDDPAIVKALVERTREIKAELLTLEERSMEEWNALYEEVERRSMELFEENDLHLLLTERVFLDENGTEYPDLYPKHDRTYIEVCDNA